MPIFAMEEGRLLPSGEGLSDEQREALDLEHHIVVVAGAGSGKTRTLTRRYLRILGALAWEAGDAARAPGPESILVTTFTERAAAEMRGRIRAELGLAVRELGDRAEELTARVGAARLQSLTRHLRAARQGFDRARIGTFHSFASSVLREFAASAGLDPGFQILESVDEAALREHAALEALSAAERAGEPGALFETFSRRAALDALRIWVKRRHELGPFLETLRRGDPELLQLWHERYADVALDDLERETAPSGVLFGAIEAYADLEHDLRNPASPPPAIANCKRALELMSESPPSHPVERADRLRRIAALFRTREGRGYLAKTHYTWTGQAKDVTLPERQRELKEGWTDLRPLLVEIFGEWAERLDSLLGAPDRVGAEALRALAQVGQDAARRYTEALEQARCLDFGELEARVLALLDGNEAVRKRLQARFRHLLVDEFQDTNTSQWRVTRLLAGDPLPSAGLFLVGDPKQAIYRFRGGDVTVFERARRELARVGGRELRFSWNFRSRRGLIDGFNGLFGWLMPEGEDAPPWEARFEPLEARRRLESGDARPGRIDLVWLEEEPEEPYAEAPDPEEEEDEEPPAPDGIDLVALDAEERAQAEAAALPLELGNLPPAHQEARHVARLIATALLPGGDVHEGIRVAVLLRRRTHLAVYARALREEGVPHVVARGRGFFGRQEVQDLGNLLLALAHPDDSIALLGALRGPLLRLEDAWLLWLARLGREARERALARGWARVVELTAAPAGLRLELDEAAGWGELPEEGQRALTDAAERFLRWRALTRELPLSGFLRQVVTETASVYGLARTDPTGQAMANVEKLIALALSYDSRGAEGLADFADFLGRQGASEADEGDATLDATAPVVLMTIHQSKGLEFPCVVLPDLAQALRRTGTDPVLLARLPGGEDPSPDAPDLWEVGIAVPVVLDGRRASADMLLRRLIRRQDRWEDLAEARRLLYVAATRARDRLVTFALPLGKEATKRIEAEADKDEASSWSEWLGMWTAPGSPGVRIHAATPSSFPGPELLLDAAETRDWLRTRGRAYLAPPPVAPDPGDLRALARALAPVASEPLRRTSPHALQRPLEPSPSSPSPPVDPALRPPPGVDPRAAGLLRGLVVHSCLEDGLTRPSSWTQRRVRQALAHEGLLSEAAEAWLHGALVRHLRGFRRAAPLELTDEAAVVFHELPFRLRLPPAAVDGGGAAWLDGVIDAVYRQPEARCWMVLDYKSDEGDPEALAASYLPQILAYAWAASRVLPDLRDSGWRIGGELLFTGPGRRVRLFEPMSAEEVDSAFRAALRAGPQHDGVGPG